MIASGTSKKPYAVKVAIFLNIVGEDSVEIFNTFNLPDEARNDYKEVIKAFENYIRPRRNVPYERFLLYSRKQKEGEPFQQLITDLKTLVRSCEFDDQVNDIVRDCIFMGVCDKILQKEMLQTQHLTLEWACELATLAEVSQQQLKCLQSITPDTHLPQSGTTTSVNTVVKHKRGQDWHSRKSSVQAPQKCKQCRFSHPRYRCPAYGKPCFKCGKLNHFSNMCKNINHIKEVKVAHHHNSDSESEDTFFINGVQVRAESAYRKVKSVNNLHEVTKWHEVILIEDVKLNLKLGSWSEVNIIPETIFNKANRQFKVRDTSETLECYGEFKIKHKGIVSLRCETTTAVEYLEFCIVSADRTPILGLDACLRLNLIKRIHSVEPLHSYQMRSQQDPKTQFIQDNIDVFQGLGKFPYRCNMSV
ncbi:hypothetical protein PR048_007996 [Dryococelus australis]|uniref:CCHC-type domain-containing protein n=1 Tax=Dryococelus australis TaxID=614101 RepID=A0ABQ9HWR4_9NEOP|nr:hypothetical protein PR048_007996 [Dryococelus australis]